MTTPHPTDAPPVDTGPFEMHPVRAYDVIDVPSNTGTMVYQNDFQAPDLWCDSCGQHQDDDEGPCVHLAAVLSKYGPVPERDDRGKMPAPPVPPDLDALAALCAAFTGPVWLILLDLLDGTSCITDDRHVLYLAENEPEPQSAAWLDALIAKANALPLVLAELTTARAEADTLRHEHDESVRMFRAMKALQDAQADVIASYKTAEITLLADLAAVRNERDALAAQVAKLGRIAGIADDVCESIVYGLIVSSGRGGEDVIKRFYDAVRIEQDDDYVPYEQIRGTQEAIGMRHTKEAPDGR